MFHCCDDDDAFSTKEINFLPYMWALVIFFILFPFKNRIPCSKIDILTYVTNNIQFHFSIDESQTIPLSSAVHNIRKIRGSKKKKLLWLFNNCLIRTAKIQRKNALWTALRILNWVQWMEYFYMESYGIVVALK